MQLRKNLKFSGPWQIITQLLQSIKAKGETRKESPWRGIWLIAVYTAACWVWAIRERKRSIRVKCVFYISVTSSVQNRWGGSQEAHETLIQLMWCFYYSICSFDTTWDVGARQIILSYYDFQCFVFYLSWVWFLFKPILVSTTHVNMHVLCIFVRYFEESSPLLMGEIVKENQTYGHCSRTQTYILCIYISSFWNRYSLPFSQETSFSEVQHRWWTTGLTHALYSRLYVRGAECVWGQGPVSTSVRFLHIKLGKWFFYKSGFVHGRMSTLKTTAFPQTGGALLSKILMRAAASLFFLLLELMAS